MAFRFALASLLRYRESIEEREDLLLRNAQQEVAAIRSHIAQIEQQRKLLIQSYEKALSTGVIASELHSFMLQRRQMEQAIQQLSVQLKEAEKQRDQQRKAYQVARQKREVLSIVRDRQKRAYEIEEARREQRQLDDLFLSRRKQDE
jgi:flagellar FliJ protein